MRSKAPLQGPLIHIIIQIVITLIIMQNFVFNMCDVGRGLFGLS